MKKENVLEIEITKIEEAEKVKEELDEFWAKVRAGEIGGDE